MTTKRTVEIFTAGCFLCEDALNLMNQIACGSCEVIVLDMNTNAGSERAREVGVSRVPAIAVNGSLLACCETKSIGENEIREAGIGASLG